MKYVFRPDSPLIPMQTNVAPITNTQITPLYGATLILYWNLKYPTG